MNKIIELLLGLVLFLAPVILAIQNIGGLGTAALEFIKGGLVILVALIGLMFIMLGITDMGN